MKNRHILISNLRYDNYVLFWNLCIILVLSMHTTFSFCLNHQYYYYYYYLFHIPLDPNTNTGLQPLDMERVNEKIHYIQS
jgi:hypothetical protein